MRNIRAERVTVRPKSSKKSIIDLLKADHRMVEEMFESFEKSRNKIQRRRLLDEIVKELSIHATVEEKFVYPILIEEKEEMTEEAFEEHHVVKLILAELADYDGSEENARAKVKVLSEMVRHHVEEEEGELLPKLKKMHIDLHGLGAKVEQEKERLKGRMQQVGDKSKRQIGGGPVKRTGTSNSRRRAS